MLRFQMKEASANVNPPLAKLTKDSHLTENSPDMYLNDTVNRFKGSGRVEEARSVNDQPRFFDSSCKLEASEQFL
jgi:hypothetical protein